MKHLWILLVLLFVLSAFAPNPCYPAESATDWSWMHSKEYYVQKDKNYQQDRKALEANQRDLGEKHDYDYTR